MKKILVLFVLTLFLSGCATYKFKPGQPPYDKGYVAARENYTMLEYTLGRDSSVPDIKTAKERFRRRRNIVEHYYKKMGYIENHFKMAFMDPSVTFLKFMGGIFRLPAIAISDYRYEHNPKYRKRVQQREAERDLREEVRISKFKEKLNLYVEKDIAREGKIKPQKEAIISEKLDKTEQAVVKTEKLEQQDMALQKKEEAQAAAAQQITSETKVEEKPRPQEQKPKAEAKIKRVKQARQAAVPKTVPGKIKSAEMPEPKVIIVARPPKGNSPLKVHFSAKKSYSPGGKIIFYQWDFGDGDKSTKADPVNTYYSGSFEPQQFTATLTVQDDKGQTAVSSITVEVLNR